MPHPASPLTKTSACQDLSDQLQNEKTIIAHKYKTVKLNTESTVLTERTFLFLYILMLMCKIIYFIDVESARIETGQVRSRQPSMLTLILSPRKESKLNQPKQVACMYPLVYVYSLCMYVCVWV